MPANEAQLIAAWKDGGEGAFAALYDLYARKIYDYLYYRTHHRETAEDLASTTFLKALESGSRFDPEKGGFGPWIYRIARNTLIDHYRSAKPSSDIEDVWDALKSGEDVARDAETRERLRAVEARLQDLPSGQREILLLRLWDGLSHAEIAAITGKSEAASKMAFSRGLSNLRKDGSLLALFLVLHHFIKS